MITKTVIDFLTDAGFDAYAERPEKPPDEYIIVEQMSGGKTNGLSRARVAVQCYSGTLFNSMQLDESVRHTMDDITSLPELSGCELENSYNYTLTPAKQYRWQSIYNIHYYD